MLDSCTHLRTSSATNGISRSDKSWEIICILSAYRPLVQLFTVGSKDCFLITITTYVSRVRFLLSSVKNYSVYIKIYETNFNVGCKSNLPNATKATNNNVTLKIICLHDRTKKCQPISFMSYDDPSTVGCCPVWHKRIIFLKRLGTCHIHMNQDPLNPTWKLRLRI